MCVKIPIIEVVYKNCDHWCPIQNNGIYEVVLKKKMKFFRKKNKLWGLSNLVQYTEYNRQIDIVNNI